MSLESIIISIIGALGVAVLRAFVVLTKDWIVAQNKNTAQLMLLNDKFEVFVQEIKDLRVDVDDLKLWRARVDKE